MKGEAQPLIKFFDGSDKRFIIPLYQRNYDWNEDNCKQLFSDLISLQQSGRKNHFFGSIVSTIQSGTEDRYIIDGQQRITTVSLILIALVNAAKDGLISYDDPRITEKIFKRYLVDEYQEGERKVKLKPIKKDMQAFDALLYRPKDEHIQGSNVTRNYNYFYDKILKCGLKVDGIFDAIKRLEVINIKLDDDDDAQLIFESLNSTGLDLSEADKIRNYLLMSLSPQEQEQLYSKHWNPIEENTNYDPSPFVRDYLTMKQGKIGKVDRIYFIFKEYAEIHKISRSDLLDDMHYYARIYHNVLHASFGREKIDMKLKQLRILDSAIAHPYLMAFFDWAEKNSISDDEQFAVLDIVENYWARRIMCDLPSNALNKVFATLHRDVLNFMAKSNAASDNAVAPARYIDVLTFVLLSKNGTARFPEDKEVSLRFADRQVYKMPANAKNFIMERMENRDNRERHDVVGELQNKHITIEHIMPQTLSDKWKTALGPEYERIHQQYLHTMANLTLTGYNSKYSNLEFKDKRDMDKGFKESAYRLNNEVKLCEKWTEDELIKRKENLLGVFLHLWGMPSTEFTPVQKSVESAALDDEDFEFTGRKLQAFVFHDTRYTVPSWKEMLIQVCSICLLEHKAMVEWICANNYYCMHRTAENGCHAFADGLYVWADNSTSSKLAILKGLFTECNIPYSELVFEFWPEYEDDDETGNQLPLF